MKKFAGILALVVAGCRGQQYFAEGPGRSFDVSGEYRVEERPGRNNCRTISPRVEDRIIFVEHTPNSAQLVLVVGKESFAATLRSDGRFETGTVARGQGYNSTATKIKGAFRKSAFTAAVTVTASDDIPPTAPQSRPASTAVVRSCEYVVTWEGRIVN
jgi:hypothetical protein